MLAALVVPLLAGCGALGSKKPPPRCPEIFLLKNANSVTYFKPGPGRDITDVLATIRIVDFRGECQYNRKRTKALIALNVAFDVRRGPADRSKTTDFRYFVAIPKFHPSPQGKSVFPLRAKFEGNQTRLSILDEVRLEIPMPPFPKVDEYSVYMGIQLTPQQLEYNRLQANRKRRR
ncbi:MAG: hypothetical protein CMM52_13555 [Rhodospirillaceae bacterium]|nr:hypothetical protein [Rhodospirillaceae bacterium]|tara:strand:+ start:4494 stop:5021 length:528 start_codon:yes stop_codon:yes gene_type:complete